jgi:hypothetical protein
VGGTTRKFAVARPAIPTVWPIQEGINLTQKEVTTLEEERFSFDRMLQTTLEVYLASNLLV